MAKVIEFYIPDNFRRRVKWVSPEQRGKVIEFGTGNPRAVPVVSGDCAGDFSSQPALVR
jgi:hypothetical protein